MRRPWALTPTIPASHSCPWVAPAGQSCPLQPPSPRPRPPFKGEGPHPGTRGRGHVCQEGPPGDTWLFAVREAAEIKRLFSQWERSQGGRGPGSRRGCCSGSPPAARLHGAQGRCTMRPSPRAVAGGGCPPAHPPRRDTVVHPLPGPPLKVAERVPGYRPPICGTPSCSNSLIKAELHGP